MARLPGELMERAQAISNAAQQKLDRERYARQIEEARARDEAWKKERLAREAAAREAQWEAEHEQAIKDGRVRRCVQCKREFTSGLGEASWFKAKGFAMPVRCKVCRAARKEQKRLEIQNSYDGWDPADDPVGGAR